MKRALVAGLVVLMMAFAPLARGQGAGGPPAGEMSENVEFVANIPEMASAIALGFIGDTMFVSTVHGLYAYGISDPGAPSLIGALPMYIWENEDMDVDPARNYVFISRDPRGFTSPGTTAFPYGAVHIIDASNPHALTQLNVFTLPSGHTSTCVNGCDFLWTGGPATGATQPTEWGGRPVFATDITDPMNPIACPDPIDTGRNDGRTDYAHDVSVDANGIAWVSGRGGVRGYWTEGRHVNPLTGKRELATGCDPIPYAGGGTPEEATPSTFMHNAWHNVKARVEGRRGDVLYASEENVTTECASSGRFVTYDLLGSYDGEGWIDIDQTHFRMRALDVWTPEGEEGSTGCDSAHWFQDRGDFMLAVAFYGQGTRFLDVSNPKKIQQVGYYRPDDASAWAAYWHDGYVYVPDFTRGVDILRFDG
ncbi:MAG: LVIVD repeat-containing protein [Actinomycetota bacterium]